MRRVVGLIILGVILLITAMASAEIEFIPEAGKLYVRAKGKIEVLENDETKYVLKLEQDRIYILTGKLSRKIQRLEGEAVEIEGLLRPRIKSGERLIPAIEVRKLRKIRARGEER